MNTIQKNKKKYVISGSIQELFFLVCFCWMLTATIINRNRFVAGLSFTRWPTLALLAASVLLLLKGVRITRSGVYALLLAIIALISTRINSGIAEMGTCVNLIICCVTFAILSGVRISDEIYRHIISFYLQFCFVICVLLTINYVRYSSIVFGRVTIEVFGQNKDTAYLSAFISPAFALNLFLGIHTKEKRRFLLAGYEFVVLFLVGQRGSFMAMLLAAALMLISVLFDRGVKHKYALIVVIAVGGSIAYQLISRTAIFSRTTDFSAYGGNIRFTLWRAAMEALRRSPLIGSGIQSGSYYTLQMSIYRTHGCYIDLLTGEGILGVILFVLLVLSLLRGKGSKTDRLYLIILFVSFMLPLAFLNGYECATFWMPMSLCLLSSNKCREDSTVIRCFSVD